MPDIYSKAMRSYVMSRIRGKGNRDTELVVARLFRRQGVTGWRRQYPMFGKPDFVFRKERVVVFVDGCFWHGCPKHSNLPVQNRAFWRNKLGNNKKRDRLVSRTLRKEGWRVVRVWEHDLTGNPAGCILRICKALETGKLIHN